MKQYLALLVNPVFIPCTPGTFPRRAICGVHIESASCVQTAEGIRACPDQVAEGLVAKCISGNFGKIRSCGVVVISCVQSIWGSKMCICASYFSSLFVHKLYKLVGRTADMFCKATAVSLWEGSICEYRRSRR